MAEKVGAARAVRAATVVRAEATEGRAAPLAGRVEWGATAAAWVVPEAAVGTFHWAAVPAAMAEMAETGAGLAARVKTVAATLVGG